MLDHDAFSPANKRKHLEERYTETDAERDAMIFPEIVAIASAEENEESKKEVENKREVVL